MKKAFEVLEKYITKDRVGIFAGIVLLMVIGLILAQNPLEKKPEEFAFEPVDLEPLTQTQRDAFDTRTLEDTLLDEVLNLTTLENTELSGEKNNSFAEEEQALVALEREEYQWNGRDLAIGKAILREYDPEDWRHIVEQGIHTVVIFYTKDCESCDSELENVIIPAFEEFGDDVVYGVVVRFQEGELTMQATQLAGKFGVTGENTKVLAQFSQAALKRFEGEIEKDTLKALMFELWQS